MPSLRRGKSLDGKIKTMIKANNISFSYAEGKPNVLENVSLELKKGTYTAILGHNGSGKSTLAKLLCGLLLPTDGEITVDGLITSNEENEFEIRKKCAMVFQNPDNQIVASVVEEDVAFAPENLGIPSDEIRKIVDECLATVGMEKYARHSTYKLSGGQKQRVAIAGVLAMMPECIIFDEATAMLDPEGRKDIVSTMKKLNREKKLTVVTITHHMNEAALADNIIVMNKGKVFASGTPVEIFKNVEAMKSIGLSVPQVTEMCYMLKKDGYDIDTDVLHTMDAADRIERLFL